MLYNDNVSYSQSGVSYAGSLTISAPGFSSNISLQNIQIYLSEKIDNSNQTQSSFITINFFSSGNVTFETANTPNGAGLVSTSVIESSYSGLVSISNV